MLKRYYRYLANARGDTQSGVAPSDTASIIGQMRWSDKVKALMLERGITQEALAPVLKVKTRGAVGHILTGRRQMSAHQLMALARYFGVTVEELFGDEELDFDAIRLARAIESLPADKKGHLSAVVDAFTQSLAGESWDGVTERRKTRN